MTDIISVLHGFDKDWEPIQDTIGRESAVFTKNLRSGQMVTRTGLLIDIIETSSSKFLGVVAPDCDNCPQKTFKGFLVQQNEIAHEWDEE